MAKMIIENPSDHNTKCYILTNDIDLNNQKWTPIGNTYENLNNKQFLIGSFDGKGHTISNLNVVHAGGGRFFAWGLFGWCEGYIGNLNVKGNMEIAKPAASYVGGIVGNLSALHEPKEKQQ